MGSIKIKNNTLIFQNQADKKRAIKILMGQGMNGLEHSLADKKSLEIELVDSETLECALDFIEE